MAMSAYATLQSLKYYLTTEPPASRPTTWQVSLHTGDPGPDGTANEVTDAAYVRQTGAFATDNTDPDAPFADNTGLISYPAAAVGFTATHMVVWGTGSNPLVIQRLVTDRVVGVGVQAQFAVGEIIIGGTQE